MIRTEDYRIFIHALFEHVEVSHVDALLESVEDANPYSRQCAICRQDEIPIGEDGEDGWIPVHLSSCPVGMVLEHMMRRVLFVEDVNERREKAGEA